jgi:hypothetical protein
MSHSLLFNTDTDPILHWQPPLFQFQMTSEAAMHNERVLSSFNYYFAVALEAQKDMPIGIGNEFWPPALLEPLLQFHPLWPQLKLMLLQGMALPLTPLTLEQWTLDNTFHLQWGNHKSASLHAAALKAELCEDIIRGFTLPLPIFCIPNIPTLSLAPLGITKQATIDDHGERTSQWRMTHNQSFPGPSTLSVNLCTPREWVCPMQIATLYCGPTPLSPPPMHPYWEI